MNVIWQQLKWLSMLLERVLIYLYCIVYETGSIACCDLTSGDATDK